MELTHILERIAEGLVYVDKNSEINDFVNMNEIKKSINNDTDQFNKLLFSSSSFLIAFVSPVLNASEFSNPVKAAPAICL